MQARLENHVKSKGRDLGGLSHAETLGRMLSARNKSLNSRKQNQIITPFETMDICVYQKYLLFIFLIKNFFLLFQRLYHAYMMLENRSTNLRK